MLRPSFMLLMLLGVLPASAAETAQIPLVKGMVVTTAVQKPNGDEEQIATISDATAAYVEVSVEFRSQVNGKLMSDTRMRRVRREDMASSNKQNQDRKSVV